MILRQLLSSIAILSLLMFTSLVQAAGITRVAVLPFEVYSNVRSTGLEKIITQDLSMHIAEEGQITVVDQPTITTLLDKSTPTFSQSALLGIAEKLEADFLVLGSVTKIGENLSLDTYLFNARGTPSFSKDFTEGKNLTVLLKKMGTKISSQVIQTARSYREAQEPEEKIVFKKPGDTEPAEPAAVDSTELPEFQTREEEAVEERVVANAETGELETVPQPLDSEEGDDQPLGSLEEEAAGEVFIEEVRQEAPAVTVAGEEVVEERVVAYAETDELETVAQPQALDTKEDDDQPSEIPAEEAIPESTLLTETADEEDTTATVALLPKTKPARADKTEKERKGKSFSSPFSTVKPVKITSKSMEADNKRNMVTFKGSVVVKQEDMVIFSDIMEVTYEPKGGINRVEASGNVKMSQENRIATGKKLVFFNPEQKIVMTGSPKIWQGDNLISCEKVTVLLEDDKIVFEGKVDSVIYPKSIREQKNENEGQVEEITPPPGEGESGYGTVVE